MAQPRTLICSMSRATAAEKDRHPNDVCQMDIALIRQWAEEAGEVALARFRYVRPQLKEGDELVTLADREVEAYLVERVRATYPGHAIIGEEGGAHQSQGDCLWAIDPIDGTRAFVSGLPVWGVSIGLLARRPASGPSPCSAGVFYMPLLREMYHVDVRGDACWNGRPLTPIKPGTWDANALLCVPADAHRAYDIRFQGITRAMGSTAANLIYVARGSALGALIAPVHIWDLAAALAILERVGGEVRYLSGRPVDVGALMDGRRAAEPMLAAAPADLARFLEQVRLKEK